MLTLVCAQGCAARRASVLPQTAKSFAGQTLESSDPQLKAALLKLRFFPSAAQHRAAASEYRRLGVLDTAFDHLTAAIRMDRKDAAAYDARARIWRDWGAPQLGMGDAARAVVYAPQSAAARNTLGTLLLANGQPEEARREFVKALALDPSASFARENLDRLDRLQAANR